MPTYLVEAKEAQLSHYIQGTDPGPCGDLSSHLQTDFNDLQRIGENHLGSSGLQETRENLNMDGRPPELRTLKEALAWKRFSNYLNKLLHKNAVFVFLVFFLPESQKEKWPLWGEEKEWPLREEQLRSEQT